MRERTITNAHMHTIITRFSSGNAPTACEHITHATQNEMQYYKCAKDQQPQTAAAAAAWNALAPGALGVANATQNELVGRLEKRVDREGRVKSQSVSILSCVR